MNLPNLALVVSVLCSLNVFANEPQTGSLTQILYQNYVQIK